MTTTNDVTETSAQVHLDIMVRRYAELKRLISEAQHEADFLRDQLKGHILETGEVIEVEGLPPLRLKDGGSKLAWDSTAIMDMQIKRPHEWERVCELGAVQLDAKVLREAVANGQLAGLPGGYVTMKLGERLEFDRARR